jgi:hypothetical protein
MNKRIKIVRQLEQVFRPYRMMLKELKGGGGGGKKKKHLPSQYFCKEKKNTKNNKTLLFGKGVQLFADFRF